MKTKIDDLTIGEVKELLKILNTDKSVESPSSHPYTMNKLYLIRTVTFTYTGVLIGVYEKELEFKNVCWIADTGRFSTSLEDLSNLKEVEPYSENTSVIIGRGAIVDISIVQNQNYIPNKQK